MTGLDLVIFDCDGVLVDSELLSTQAIQRVLAAEGIDVPLDAITRCIGMKQADILKSVSERMQVSISPAVADHIWPATLGAFPGKPGLHPRAARVSGPPAAPPLRGLLFLA